MFGSQILDTAIGIVFIFVLVSTLVTIGNELIASILSSRAKWLAVGVQRLLGDDLAARFYAHPLIGGAQAGGDEGGQPSVLRRLARAWAREGSARPSYIASRTFANVLLDLVCRQSQVLQKARTTLEALAEAGAADLAAFSGKAQQAASELAAGGCPAVAAALRRLVLQWPAGTSPADAGVAVLRLSDTLAVHGLQDSIAAWPDPRLGHVLHLLLTDAEGDLDKFKENVEVWFNNAMDRVAGWYKRRSQWVVFALGAIVAVVMNIDTLMIIHFLQTSPGARDSLVAQAKAYASVKDNAPTDPAIPVINAGDSYNGTLHLGASLPQDDTVTLASDSPGVTLARSEVALKAGQQDVPVQVQTASSGSAVDATISGTLPAAGGNAAPSGTLRLHVSAGLPSQFESIQSRLLQLDLPIGWVRNASAKDSDRHVFNVIPDRKTIGDTVLFHLLGWFVTALAATLGAPFWFDMLNRIVAIRSSGKAPEEKPKPPKAVQLPLEPGESPREAAQANAASS